GHRPLDPPRHEVGVRRLSVLLLEPAAQVAGGQIDLACQRGDVEWLAVGAVDAVAHLPQQLEFAQPLVLLRAWHGPILPASRGCSPREAQACSTPGPCGSLT